jgi:hypothetical protein
MCVCKQEQALAGIETVLSLEALDKLFVFST